MPNTHEEAPFEVEIELMGGGGVGMGRHKNRTVFVPYTIPGETVLAQPVGSNDHLIHANGITLVDASADRVIPRCPHFGPGRCGKCQWQHIDYDAQVLIKHDVLADQLERGGIRNPPLRSVIASPKAWVYNYHMTFGIGGRNGSESSEAVDPAALYLGFPSIDNEQRLIRIEECHVLHPDLLDLYDQLDLDLSGLRRVKMQIGSDGGMMLILTALTDTAPELETELRVSVNLILPDNEPMNLIGDSHTRYDVNGHLFRVTAGSYYRANAEQVPQLVNTVLELLDPQVDEAVLDLYAGVGVFSAFLAPRVDLVSMIESYPPAVTDAEKNLEAFENVDVFEGSVDAVLNSLDETYTAAVIDPPPQGMSADALRTLSELGMERAVYLADDPSALTKTIKMFRKQGYELAVVQPIDFAPQTHYLDMAALFIRQ
ncbi:MAG: hypothetical protein U0670_04735 [Anaerolineae bacterium]